MAYGIYGVVGSIVCECSYLPAMPATNPENQYITGPNQTLEPPDGSLVYAFFDLRGVMLGCWGDPLGQVVSIKALLRGKLLKDSSAAESSNFCGSWGETRIV